MSNESKQNESSNNTNNDTEEESLLCAREEYKLWYISRFLKVIMAFLSAYAIISFYTGRKTFWFLMLKFIAFIICAQIAYICQELQIGAKHYIESCMDIEHSCQILDLWPSKGIRLYRKRIRQWKKSIASTQDNSKK